MNGAIWYLIVMLAGSPGTSPIGPFTETECTQIIDAVRNKIPDRAAMTCKRIVKTAD